MKKKELLIVDFVFGKEYQGYIPIFLFSIYKHYPDYEAIIYIDRKVGKETERLLNLVPGYGEKYKLVFINKFVRNLLHSQMAAYRYLIYDPVFEQYKYLYIGDIDFYICKESIPLHKQHIIHMNSQQLVYSNMIREYIGVNIFYHKRMTGLHFVNVSAYYKAIEKQREHFYRVYYNTDILSKLYNLKMKTYSDEELLYYIIKKSHLSLPRIDGNNSNDMKAHNFRPHHGLHFGMWRGRKKADSGYDKYLQTQLFQDYYAQFKAELAHDTILQEIVENSPIKIKKIINAMISDLDKR